MYGTGLNTPILLVMRPTHARRRSQQQKPGQNQSNNFFNHWMHTHEKEGLGFPSLLTSIAKVSNIKVHGEGHGVESVGQHEGPHRLPHQQRQQQELQSEKSAFQEKKQTKRGVRSYISLMYARPPLALHQECIHTAHGCVRQASGANHRKLPGQGPAMATFIAVSISLWCCGHGGVKIHAGHSGPCLPRFA